MTSRTLALSLLLLFGGCGDDGGTPDLASCEAPSAAASCCPGGVVFPDGQPCDPVGSICRGFEWSCACAATKTWSCQSTAFGHDMAHADLEQRLGD